MKRRIESRDNADSIDELNMNTLISATHQNEVRDNTYQKYLQGELCDVTLIAADDGKRIAAHRLVLTSASQYFRTMFGAPSKKSVENVATLNEIAGDILESIITFCYTGTIKINNNNIDGIVAAASVMQLARLEELCQDYLLRTLNRSNCLELMLLASLYKYERLIDQVDTFVMDNFQHFIQKNEFLHAKIEALEMLLKNDHLFVFSEEVIFSAIVRWIEFDEDNRKSMFKQLMAFVRIDQLQMAFFTSTVFEYCNKWNNLELFADMLKQRNDPEIQKSPRLTTTNAIPFIVGSSFDVCKRHNEFVLNKLDFHKNEWRTIHSFSGYREGHSVVQVDHFLYIIGGKDVNGTILNTVQRLNLKTWELDDIRPMAHHRTGLLSVYLDGLIYAICVEVNRISVDKYNIQDQKWMPTELFECIFKMNGSEAALVARHTIFIINAHSMICYDPKCATVANKLAPQGNVDKCNIFINNEQLTAYVFDPILNENVMYRYNCVLDRWSQDIACAQDINFSVLCVTANASNFFMYGQKPNKSCCYNVTYFKLSKVGRIRIPVIVLAYVEHESAVSHHDMNQNFQFILPV